MQMTDFKKQDYRVIFFLQHFGSDCIVNTIIIKKISKHNQYLWR